MNTAHTTLALTRTNADGETFVTNYDTRICHATDILMDVAVELGVAEQDRGRPIKGMDFDCGLFCEERA